MANVLSLAMKVSADASGFVGPLTKAERGLAGLSNEAAKSTAVLDKFAAGSAAAAAAQASAAADFQKLSDALKNGLDPQEYARQFASLTQAAKDTADAFAEGIRVTEANRTAEEKRATELERLQKLLDLGAIEQETYNRAVAEASGANAATAASEAERQSLLQEGVRVTEQYRTVEEKRATELARLDQLLAQGAIEQETYNRATAEASGANAAAAAAEKERLDSLAVAQRERDKLLQDGVRITQQFATEEQRRAQQIAELDTLLDAGAISEETYARAKDQASGATKAAAEAEAQHKAVLQEGARLTEQYRTTEEKRAAELERIDKLLAQGAISEQTASRAKAEASGASEAAAAAEKERSQAIAAAARIIQANLTPQEKYDQQLQELRGHLESGRLSQEQFNRAATAAKRDLENVGKAAGGTDKNIESLTKNVRLLTAIEVGRVLVDGLQLLGGAFRSVTSQITSLVTSVNSSLSSLDDLSARTGISVESLQGYSFAAKLAGVDTEQFGTAVQKLSVNIGKAAPGDTLDKSLKSIGLSVKEVRALAPEQQFSAIASAISELPTAADRAAAAVEIFGKQGAALAPLFREGASSIDELRLEAEQLGAIVNETQVGNIGDMNDAFDMVLATVQGITGQVIGNLAPAVTDVADQFLEFVKGFNGNEGGTGIANAITDVLLAGAEKLAEVFDYAVKQLSGFSGALTISADIFKVVGGVFTAVGNTFSAVTESLRTVFNLFEIAGNVLLLGLGKFLEGLGSYVSSDLQEMGRSLAADAEAAAQRNSQEMEQAAINAAEYAKKAAEATVGVFTGNTATAEAAGAGAAQEYVQGFAQSVAQARLPEVKLETNADKIRERFDNLFNGIVEQGGAAAEAMQSFELAMARAQEDGVLTKDEIARIEELQRKVNVALDEETRKRAEARDAAIAQVESDQKRVEALTKAGETETKLADDIAAVTREQKRLQEELAAARADNSRADADAAVAELARLDQLRAKLEETQQAADQGFTDGFKKAFKETDAELVKLVGQAEKFGVGGAMAYRNIQAAVAAAQKQAEDGILNKAAYEREVERQKQIFQERLVGAQRVEDFLRSQLTARQKIELDAAKVIEERKKAAILNVKAIEDRIAANKMAVEEARGQGDLKTAKAKTAELRQLQVLQKQEEKIANAKGAANRQLFAQQTQQQAAFANLAQKQIAQQQSALQSAVDLTNNAFATAAARQQEFLRQLNTLGSRTVETADVRTQEGAAIVLGLAANAQDPNLIEARIQTKLQRQLVEGVAATFNRIGLPVLIPA
jgi:hypothetical protein